MAEFKWVEDIKQTCGCVCVDCLVVDFSSIVERCSIPINLAPSSHFFSLLLNKGVKFKCLNLLLYTISASVAQLAWVLRSLISTTHSGGSKFSSRIFNQKIYTKEPVPETIKTIYIWFSTEKLTPRQRVK